MTSAKSLSLGLLNLLLISLLFIPGCTRHSPSNSNPSLTNVTLALNWMPEIEHGGFYTALLNGHYKDAGLNVEILPGGPNAPVAQRVATKQVDFGVSSADRTLQARAAGANLVTLLAPLQHSPRCLMTHPESNITSFDQIKDVTLAMSESDPYSQFLKSKLPLTNVRIVPYTGSIAQFLLDKKMIIQGYTFSEPILAQAKGVTPKILTISDFGYDPYNSTLITHSDLLKEKPELVQKIIKATQKGWIDFLKDPAKTNDFIHALNPEMDRDAMTKGMPALIKLCEAPAGTTFGTMTKARWDELGQQLIDLKLLEPGTDISTAWTPLPAAN